MLICKSRLDESENTSQLKLIDADIINKVKDVNTAFLCQVSVRRGGRSAEVNTRDEYTMPSYTWSRKRVKLKVVGSDWMVMCLIVLSVFGQVSEECPVSCECKWKSGKESVVCQDLERKLESIPTGLDPGTQVLNLSGNKLQTLPAFVFLKLNLLNLQKLFLAECTIKSLDSKAFSKLINLVELDLSGNKLERVPTHTFNEIPELRELKLNSNSITRVNDDAFGALSNLVRLEMTKCGIVAVEANAFRGLASLEWLKLDGNRLRTIHASSLYPMKNLNGLEMHSNPWNCSCDLQPLREWMRKHNVPYGVPPVCSDPRRLAGRSWEQLQVEDFACLPKVQSSSAVGVPQISKTIEGNNATLLCRLQATPDTQVRWWNGNKPVVISSIGGGSPHYLLTESFAWEPGERGSNNVGSGSSGKMMLGTKTSTLTVLKARLKDSGPYSCRAESRAGSVSANFTLIILQRKTDVLTGRFLLYGAALAAMITLGVCILLLCTIFLCGRRQGVSRSRSSEKLELNCITEGENHRQNNHNHPTGQNGGVTIPLISPTKDESPFQTKNSSGQSHFTPNAATNNKGFVLMGKKVGGVPSRTSTAVLEPKSTNGRVKKGTSATNSTNYTRVSTHEELEDQSYSENDENSDEERTDVHLQQETTRELEVMFVDPGKPVSKPATSTSGNGSCIVSPASSSSVGSLNANSGKRVGECSTSKGPPDVIKRSEEYSSSLPRQSGPLQAEGLLADAQTSATRFYRHDPRVLRQGSYTAQQRNNAHPHMQHRRVNSDSQSPLLQPSGDEDDSGGKMTSSGYSVLSTSSNEGSPYGSTSTEHTHLSASQRTLTSGKLSFHHPHTPGQHYQYPPPPPPAYQQHPGYHQPNGGMHPYYSYRYPFQRRSMPTSPVHDNSTMYNQPHQLSPYNHPGLGRAKPPRGRTASGGGGSNTLLMRNSAGSDPQVAGDRSPGGEVDYDYHAAQLAAFLEEYRVLQTELMRMSASLQQVSEAEGTSKTPPANGGRGEGLTNQKGTVVMGVTNANNSSSHVGGNVNKGGGAAHSSLQTQQQLKSILKQTGNNNNYVA